MSTIDFPVNQSILVLDPYTQGRLLEERRRCGIDLYDEVWEGTYVMSPIASPEHQHILFQLSVIFNEVVVADKLGRVLPGANVTDQIEDWTFNYRCPDVVVVLNESRAKIVGAAIVGGPDLIVEVASPGDRWPQKLPFYSKIGVRELLVVDRDTKQLELLRLRDDQLTSIGKSGAADQAILKSEVLPVSFQHDATAERTSIVVRRTNGIAKEWRI